MLPIPADQEHAVCDSSPVDLLNPATVMLLSQSSVLRAVSLPPIRIKSPVSPAPVHTYTPLRHASLDMPKPTPIALVERPVDHSASVVGVVVVPVVVVHCFV